MIQLLSYSRPTGPPSHYAVLEHASCQYLVSLSKFHGVVSMSGMRGLLLIWMSKNSAVVLLTSIYSMGLACAELLTRRPRC